MTSLACATPDALTLGAGLVFVWFIRDCAGILHTFLGRALVSPLQGQWSPLAGPLGYNEHGVACDTGDYVQSAIRVVL